IDEEVQRMKSYLDYQLEDGDITQAERDMETSRISAVAGRAHSQAAANGGYLTGAQTKALLRELQGEPSGAVSEGAPDEIMVPDSGSEGGKDKTPDYGQMLSDFHGELNAQKNLLKRQLAKGGLSQAQYDRNSKALDQLAEDERQKASA